MSKKINLRFSVLTLLILLAAFSRILPHMPNFSPLGAIGLFGAAYFQKKWQSFLVPIVATWISDLFINNVIYSQYYPHFTWFYSGFYWQYGSYLFITFVGIFMIKRVTIQTILGGALAASIIFFLISNFGCWIGSSVYLQNLSGLLTCYAAGIPFLTGTLLGNLVYSFLLFGLFAFVQQRFTPIRISNAE